MSYPGGKSGPGVYQTIINQLPPHRIYIEPFLGGGAILRHKRPASCSIAIDADADVITAFFDDGDPQIPNLTLIHGCGIQWLANNGVSSDTLIYLDPPYLLSTRVQHRQIYRYEMTREDHKRLLAIITRLECMIVISGYWSDLYAHALAGWRTVSFNTKTRGGNMATEWLWLNFPEPTRLHDYRYLGGTFRERERIKRRITRWKCRLGRMDVLERRALLAALEEIER